MVVDEEKRVQMKWEKRTGEQRSGGVPVSVGGVMVKSGDSTGDVTVWDDKDEEWHRWTGLYRCLHVSLIPPLSLFSLSFGEMCSCDMWVCFKETCQNDHWSENEAHCNTTWQKYTHIHTYMHSHTWKSRNTLVCLSTHWNGIHSTYPIQLGGQQPHRHSWTHTHVYILYLFFCVRVCVCAMVLLNNTSLTRQSCDFKAQHMLRKGGEREREREREVRVGGLEGETKTKIQDEQWWEGQRSDRWLSDSCQCLPLMLNTFSVCLSVCLPIVSSLCPLSFGNG